MFVVRGLDGRGKDRETTCFSRFVKILVFPCKCVAYVDVILQVFFLQCHHMSLMDFVVYPPGCGRSVTSEGGTPMRRSYVVPMRLMVIHEVPGGALT
jgi:hypothetical protein